MKIAVFLRNSAPCLFASGSEAGFGLKPNRANEQKWWIICLKNPPNEALKEARAKFLSSHDWQPLTDGAVLRCGIGETIYQDGFIVHRTGKGYILDPVPWKPGDPIPAEFAGCLYYEEQILNWYKRIIASVQERARKKLRRLDWENRYDYESIMGSGSI